MAKKMTVRILTPGEYVAEMLEAEAAKMPRSYREQSSRLPKAGAAYAPPARPQAGACLGSNGVIDRSEFVRCENLSRSVRGRRSFAFEW